jgi:hypothetical protein
LTGALAGIAAAVALSACDGIDGVEINSPLLEAAGVNLLGKAKPEPNLPDRAPLVLPPNNDLPPPGEHPPAQVASANGEAWPHDPDQMKKQAAADAEAQHKDYCKNGNWTSSANIDDFRKNTGIEARCRPEWLEAMKKADEEKEKKKQQAQQQQ